jgi:hypothetical protein
MLTWQWTALALTPLFRPPEPPDAAFELRHPPWRTPRQWSHRDPQWSRALALPTRATHAMAVLAVGVLNVLHLYLYLYIAPSTRRGVLEMPENLLEPRPRLETHAHPHRAHHHGTQG